MIREIIKKLMPVVKYTRSDSGEFLLKSTDYGQIEVEYIVVEKLAQRALRQIKGIGEAQLRVEKLTEANPLKIYITMTIEDGYSAVRLSEAADRAINKALQEYLQIRYYIPVEVRVRQIVVNKKRRVR